MLKKLLLIAFIFTTWLTLATQVLAIDEGNGPCYPKDTLPNNGCADVNSSGETLFCKPLPSDRTEGTCEVFPIPEGRPCIPKDRLHRCARVGPLDEPLFCKPLDEDRTYGRCAVDTRDAIQRVFGFIEPPAPLAGLLEKDPTGAGAISQFLSNGIALIFSIAAVVLLFMIIWGAFQWMTSGGDKEGLAAAQRRILHAIIGILLFATAFAIIQVLGVFTGFRFFLGQNAKFVRDEDGNIYAIQCTNGQQIIADDKVTDPDEECKKQGQH